jgi:hypothetical protein
MMPDLVKLIEFEEGALTEEEKYSFLKTLVGSGAMQSMQ